MEAGLRILLTFSSRALLRSASDVSDKAWFAVSISIHLKGVGLGLGSVQASPALTHKTGKAISTVEANNCL